METENFARKAARTNADFAPFDFDRYVAANCADRLAEKRISQMLAAAAEREKETFYTSGEKLKAALMSRPLSTEKTFARFGLMLGAFPPAAILGRLVSGGEVWVFGVVFIVCLISATVGYFSGKRVGRAVSKLEKMSWSKMILAAPFLGALWGIVSGAAGGVIIFFFGAFFGAIVGGAVGAAALPVFTVFHRLLKREDQIEEKHFLPLAFGTTLAISALFLGM